MGDLNTDPGRMGGFDASAGVRGRFGGTVSCFNSAGRL